MRLLYLLAVYLAAPAHAATLAWRGLRERGQPHGLGERFGFGAPVPGRPLWVHAASVGEVQAAAAVVTGLRRRFAERPMLITTFTATGAVRARRLGPGVTVRYLPYDLPGSVQRFLERVRPCMGVILETELWPTLYRECHRRGIPLAIASARLSERSLRRYRRLGGLFKDTLAAATVVAAQSDEDAARFRAIGAAADRTHVIGNIKFDVALPEDLSDHGRRLREHYAAERALWVAGSTHEAEEAAVVEAHRRVRQRLPEALLALAPRHPGRFGEVAALLEARGVRYVRHSQAPSRETAGRSEVLLVDTLGELLAFYAAADAAFVGGSLVPIGGHNLLEPASLGRPVLTGPHLFNGAEVARILVGRGAAAIVHDATGLGERMSEWLDDAGLRARIGAEGLAAVRDNRGAVERLLRLIEPLCPPTE